MIKAVIYDVDGMVLSGTRFSDRYAKEFGIPLDDMKPFFAGPFEKCIVGQADLKKELAEGGWLEKWRWQGTVDELVGYWFHCGDDIDERVLDSVSELRKEGIACVLSTNQEENRAAYLRYGLGLANHFDAVFVSGEIGFKKPHPKFFDAIMKYLHERAAGIRTSDILFWDDREMHVAGAKEYGLQARLYTGFREYEQTMNSLVAY